MALNVDLPLKDANDFVSGWLILSLQYKDTDNVIKKIQRAPPTYESLIYLTHRTPPMGRLVPPHYTHPSPFTSLACTTSSHSVTRCPSRMVLIFLWPHEIKWPPRYLLE